MKPFISLIAIVLLAAFAAPFFLKVNDKPLMTVDEFVGDGINGITPEVMQSNTEVYRWQDANGVWQFGEEPPPQQQADRIEIKENLTPIARGWQGQSVRSKPATKMPSMSMLGGLTNPKKVLDEAKEGAAKLSARTEELDSMLEDLRN